MGFVFQNLPFFIVLLLLLVVSGTFSCAETVLLSLSRHDRARMRKSGNRMEVMAARLADNPRILLTTLLMGNMTCNIIIFVTSTLVLNRFQNVLDADPRTHNWLGGLLVAVLVALPPLMVTYVADVLPKVAGALNNTRIAPVIAVPVAALVRLLWPISRAVDIGMMRPIHRLVGTQRHDTAFDTDELQELLQMSEQQGVIDVSENELLQEVVRIGELKVREVMTPRVDVIAFDIKKPIDEIVALFQKTHLGKMPVFDGQIDEIVGVVYAKTLLLEAASVFDHRRIDLRRLLQPIRFVPEQQSLDRLLVHFRQTQTQFAVVVDEFGGVVGVVALEDVVEQMVGDIGEPHDSVAQAVQRIGPDEYRLSGDLSMVDWMDAFGATIERTHTATVAGFLAAKLKRIPRVGDEVRLAHVAMKVESMRGRRVDQVRLTLIKAPARSAKDVEAAR